MSNDEELGWIDAWNAAYGIPPDSVEAQRMREASDDAGIEKYFGTLEDGVHVESTRTRKAAARRVPAEVSVVGWARDEIYVAPPRDGVKPAISGLLVTAGEKWK